MVEYTPVTHPFELLEHLISTEYSEGIPAPVFSLLGMLACEEEMLLSSHE